MQAASGPHRWHDAAASATFTPYQVVGGAAVWAGGFGGRPGLPITHLEVISLVDGVEVSVDTIAVHHRRTTELGLALAVHELVGQHLLDLSAIRLPMAVSVLPDDRQLIVDGRRELFRGASVDGDTRWIGECAVGAIVLRVSAALDRSMAVSLGPVTDVGALPEFHRPSG